MTDQARKAEQFRELHVPGRPLILFNIWDAGGAKAVASGGAKAIATGSWSVANANGFADGELLPLRLAIDNLRRIVDATDLPVTVDLDAIREVTSASGDHARDRKEAPNPVGSEREVVQEVNDATDERSGTVEHLAWQPWRCVAQVIDQLEEVGERH